MKITLTNISLVSTPDINQVVHLFWKKDGEPDGSYRTLPDATVNPSGVILSPSPYQFTTEGTIDIDIIIKAVNDCDEDFTITKIIPGLELCCADGYALSEDGTLCYKTDTTEATPPTNPENTIEKNFAGYGTWGTLIYNSGYNLDGTGVFSQIPFSNPFWVNGTGYPSLSGNTTNSFLNRAGLWATTTLEPQTIGFSKCLTTIEPKTYYVAVGVDNYVTIKVDGAIVLQMNPGALDTWLAANGYPLTTSFPGECTYRFCHMYPVVIQGGNHVLEIIGTTSAGIAAVGIEIYDATSAEIIAATSYVDLGAKLIFSTKDEIGQPVQSGSGGIGYSCEEGYSLVLCDGPAYCKRTLTTLPLGC